MGAEAPIFIYASMKVPLIDEEETSLMEDMILTMPVIALRALTVLDVYKRQDGRS